MTLYSKDAIHNVAVNFISNFVNNENYSIIPNIPGMIDSDKKCILQLTLKNNVYLNHLITIKEICNNNYIIINTQFFLNKELTDVEEKYFYKVSNNCYSDSKEEYINMTHSNDYNCKYSRLSDYLQ